MHQKIILEGRTDAIVVGHLCELHNLLPVGYTEKNRRKFAVLMYGDTKRKVAIETTIDLSGMERIGIVIDIDEKNRADRWKSIKGILEGKTYTDLPNELPKEGYEITQEGLPKIGIWMMPDNESEGSLEHFYETMIDKDDALLSRAKLSVEGILNDDLQVFNPNEKQKAILYTWLAWQDKPPTSLGVAMEMKRVDINAPLALRFISWMRRTFEFSEN